MTKIKLNGRSYTQDNLDDLRIETEPINSWRNDIYYFLKNWFDDSEFILAQTSGSTGTPKVIQLRKQSMVNSALMTNRFFELTVNKTALLCLPASYIAGKMMLVRALIGGFNLLTVEPSANPFLTLETSIDFAAITPYQLHFSLDTLKLKNIHTIIVGGGQLSYELEVKSQELSAQLFETYGMTETCSHIALRQINGTGKSAFFKVLNGVSIETDQRNCLSITTDLLLPEKIQTNDVVEVSNERSFKWIGRYDNIINTGGVKIQPETLEKKLQKIIPYNFFITSLPDSILQNRVLLVLEAEKLLPEAESVLIEKMKIELTKFEVPKEIFYCKQFIYSKGNKLLKAETLSKVLSK